MRYRPEVEAGQVPDRFLHLIEGFGECSWSISGGRRATTSVEAKSCTARGPVTARLNLVPRARLLHVKQPAPLVDNRRMEGRWTPGWVARSGDARVAALAGALEGDEDVLLVLPAQHRVNGFAVVTDRRLLFFRARGAGLGTLGLDRGITYIGVPTMTHLAQTLIPGRAPSVTWDCRLDAVQMRSKSGGKVLCATGNDKATLTFQSKKVASQFLEAAQTAQRNTV